MTSLDPREAFVQGTRALLDGDARAAVALLKNAVEQAPFDVPSRFNLAVALRLQGDLSESLEHAVALLRVGVEAPQVLALAGIVSQLGGRLGDALEYFRAALSLAPEHRVSRYYLGMASLQAGERDEGIDALRAAIAPEGGPSLPVLVVERVRGQLHDVSRQGDGPRVVGLCQVNVITEIMAPEGVSEHLAPGDDPGEPAAPAPRAVSAEEVARMLHSARRVVALTGAGMSVESGLHSRKSLWEFFDRDDAVSAVRVHRSPELLWRVVRDFLGDNTHAPNPAHLCLSRTPRLVGIITQNVDSLHQRADAEWEARYPILELHGSLARTRCALCGAAGRACAAYVRDYDLLPPRCACGGALRPDVVLFGETVAPAALAEAAAMARSCDVMLVIGCAMDVAPASELPRLAARHGAAVIELKTEPSRLSDALGTHVLQGSAAASMRAVLDALSALEAVDVTGTDAPVRTPRALTRTWVERVPQIGESVAEVTLREFYRRPGDVVNRDEIIVVVDGDKASVDLPATRRGRVRALLAAPDTVVPIGAAYMLMEAVDEAPSRIFADDEGVDLAHVDIDPFLQDYGDRSGEVRDALAELISAPWFSPDASLALEEREALDWLSERLDEHAAALMRFDVARGAIPLKLFVTRDAAAAHARFDADAARVETEAHRLDRATHQRWRDALARATQHTEQRLYEVAESDVKKTLARASETVWKRALRPFREEDRAFLEWRTDALQEPLRLWLTWCAAYGRGEPSPWKPLVDIWMRGAWPFSLPVGVLGVYIPVRRGARVIPSPGADAPESLHLDVNRIPKTSALFSPLFDVPTASPRIKPGSPAR